MKYLVTGSAGHLGEALCRVLGGTGHRVIGLDVARSDWTTVVGSISDQALVNRHMQGVDVVFHSATLHKPHVATHSKQQFVDTNISGTLNLLQAAVDHKVSAFVFTSTTSVFGTAMRPAPGAPAVWVTEALTPQPRNIYGVTKLAAEQLCRLHYRQHGLPCLVLRTSRFFPEADDDEAVRARFSDRNIKANEFLYRRVEIEDVVAAHQLAAERAAALGFGIFIISATAPLASDDLATLRSAAPTVVARRVPGFAAAYRKAGWNMFEGIDRVYDNKLAREVLGWQPRHDFQQVLRCIESGADFFSPLARSIGTKGYHEQTFDNGPFPVEAPYRDD